MSVTSGFFNSVNGDRKYDAQQMSSIFDGIINDGVFASIGTAFSVQATTGNTVTVGTGRAWFDHAWLLNDSTLPIELDDAEVLLDRIDAIVIEINHSESIRAGSIKVINGTPSSTPVNPSMTNTDYINQYPIAYIMRGANSNAVTQANITYMVGSDVCPFITGLLSVVSIQNIVAQWESEFDTWLDSLSAMLDDNTAANLANQILELKEQFDTLAREKKIYSELEDSTGDDTIDDSTGNPILGTTAMYSDEGSSESIPVATGGDPYKVGDTLTTARTDLGAKWLLCNGDVLDRDLYSELASLLPYDSNITGNWEYDEVVTVTGSSLFVYGLTYLNGQYVIYGSNNSQGFIAYASNIDGPWTIKSPSLSVTKIYNAFYEAGLYVLLGESSTYHVLYANSLDGPWTIKNVPNIENRSYYYASEYHDGILSFLHYGDHEDHETYTTDYLAVSYCDNLTENIWNLKRMLDCNVSDDFSSTVMDYIEDGTALKYLNEYHIAIGRKRANMASDDNGMYAYVAYSNTLNGTWSHVELTEKSTFYNIIYVNELYIAVGTDSNGSGCVWTSSIISGPYTKKIIWNDGQIDNIVYRGGKYTIFGICTEGSTRYYAIAESTSLDGPWTKKNIVEYPTYNSSNYMEQPHSVAEDSGSAVVFRRRNPSPQAAILYYIKPGDITLPSISLSDKTYTYIRAKE